MWNITGNNKWQKDEGKRCKNDAINLSLNVFKECRKCTRKSLNLKFWHAFTFWFPVEIKRRRNRTQTHLGVLQRDGCSSLHQQPRDSEVTTSEGVMQRSHPLAQGTAGVVDVCPPLQQHGDNVCTTHTNSALQTQQKHSMCKSFWEAVTIVTVVAGFVKGGPPAVVPGVHWVTLTEKLLLLSINIFSYKMDFAHCRLSLIKLCILSRLKLMLKESD